jgi:signal transduction histidine kinase/DNA-binding response OmpR family regulator/streptogramin lyase
MKQIRLLIALVLTTLQLPAQGGGDLTFRTINMDDGLSSNTVRNILQDKYGFMWFGTDNGLCHYDGIRVTTFPITQLGSDQYISALFEHDGYIYAGTVKGVYRLNLSSMFIEQLPLDISTTVGHLTIDHENQLWVSSMEQGIVCYNLTTKAVRHYDVKGVTQVLVDHDNQIWAVSNHSSAISRLNRLHNRFEPIANSGQYRAFCMLQTHDGRMWLGSWEQGLLEFHSDGTVTPTTPSGSQPPAHHIYTLYSSGNVIYVGCDEGLLTYNPQTGQWHHQLAQNNMANRFVYSVTTDHEGGLWFGTFYGGVTYLSAANQLFKHIDTSNNHTGNIVSCFCEDHQGYIWIGSDDGGLSCYVPQQNRLTSYPHSDDLSHLNVHALTLRDKELWIGTYSRGLYVLNLMSGGLRNYTYASNNKGLDDYSVYALLRDSKNTLWIGTMRGLNRYNAADDTFEHILNAEALVIDITEDKQHRIWIATHGAGVWMYDPSTGKHQQYRRTNSDSNPTLNDHVNALHIDESGRLWLATATGLCTLDSNGKGHITPVTLNVPNQNIKGIIENNGVLWLTTERGLVRYEPQQGSNSAQRFTRSDGLTSEFFQPAATLMASDGRVYLGTTNGINMYYPYEVKANSNMPPVYITGIRFFNQQQSMGTNTPLSIPATHGIVLTYDEARMINLFFASLSYCSSADNQYEYMMEGFDKGWNITSGANPQATYTNLSAGTYTFRVRATNNHGVWSSNEATLTITVQPPFWWSWWARIFYLLLIVGAVWYYVFFRLRRAEQKHQQQLQHLQQQKEKEIREARLNFFTMVAHEVRTPVSLIIGPLEKLKKEYSPQQLDVIDRNAHRLLELVNQLLDFRKVEQQSLVMHFAPQNIHDLMRAVSERFAPTFEQKGIHFTVDYPDSRFTAIVDNEALTKVVSNLLTNANKYTKDAVSLACLVEPDEQHFRISVTDNGVGIRAEDTERIFEPFFQSEGNKPGTGIGLNIVKNIVDQHHGTINVNSQLGYGSTFIVTLPVSQEEESPLSHPHPILNRSEAATADSHYDDPSAAKVQGKSGSTSTMLIVEDNKDMSDFLANIFSDQYTIYVASDGIEALDQLTRHQIDIIISDWMMPRMDGAALCRRVRSHRNTSHIPFIMLTAKTDDDSKVEGLDVGADIYVEKPFSVAYLEACLRNILVMRRRLIERFSTQPLEPIAPLASNDTDSQFLEQMRKIIDEHIADSDLNVNFLAEQLNISRSGLFAKIKTLADITPNEMIQVMRLKRAAILLRKDQYTISEICYMVGFSNPSYFSKCFQKQFGIRPVDYMKSKRD